MKKKVSEILMNNTSEHKFKGKWITNERFCNRSPVNVFHRQLEPLDLPKDMPRNQHILFRKEFTCNKSVKNAKIYISADDYYKLYINGKFVGQGPAPAYHFNYNYNVIDVTDFLIEGANIIAVHTLYQGLINRVWQSGDNRHGLILDLMADGDIILISDESFKVCNHTGYREMGICGYKTQFLEEYDSRSAESNFYATDFDDSLWNNAKFSAVDDHILTEQKSKMLVFEKINPVSVSKKENMMVVDFGANYVGYLNICAKGHSGDSVIVRCAQELDDDGNPRYKLRANCKYEENWILTEGESSLDWFDYKSFRYAELILPEGIEIIEIYLNARHYPFELNNWLKSEYAGDEQLVKIWNLCIHTQKYGVQEVIQDCMEREKGFYVGDGCYTALTNLLLTGDDSMVRKLIDDAFLSDFITDGLVTCLNCSFMQEIAEYPLILVSLVLWHYNIVGDIDYLRKNYYKIIRLLESYRRDYEKNYLLSDLDKWCVVEWPGNFRDGYDVDITEGQVCNETHISINAYYIEAIKTANKIAKILGETYYREEVPLMEAFISAFYDKEKQLFKDSISSKHISIVGNVFPYAFGLCPEKASEEKITEMIADRKISSLSLFCTFLALQGFIRIGNTDLITDSLLDEGAWLRMLNEGATTTFEGWGKDTKWNTSLFHLTMSYAAVFLCEKWNDIFENKEEKNNESTI